MCYALVIVYFIQWSTVYLRHVIECMLHSNKATMPSRHKVFTFGANRLDEIPFMTCPVDRITPFQRGRRRLKIFQTGSLWWFFFLSSMLQSGVDTTFAISPMRYIRYYVAELYFTFNVILSMLGSAIHS